MTIVNNQNTNRQTIFGSNAKSRQAASSPPKQRKGLFSLGFFKKGDSQPSVAVRPQGRSLRPQESSLSVAGMKVPSSNASTRTTIKDPNVLPAAYNSPRQRGGQLQRRSTSTNRPTLLGKLSKRPQPTQRSPQNQFSQKQAPRPNAAVAALEARRNATNNVANPLDSMFQRRGSQQRSRNGNRTNVGQAAPKPRNVQPSVVIQDNQERGLNRNVANQFGKQQFSKRQLTKRSPTRKPTTPSPLVRRPVDTRSKSSQFMTPIITPTRTNQRVQHQQATRLSLRQSKILGKTTLVRASQNNSRAPQDIRAPLTNAKPIAKPEAAPLTSAQQHVSRLIVEIHEKAQTAKTAEEYTFILASCRRALAVEPKGELADYAKTLAAWALNRRGQLRADAGDDQHAMLDFEDALKLDSNQWRALHNRAVLRAQTGDFEQAFDDFNRCTELNPRFAKAYSNRGALFVQAGDLLAALQDYRRAIQLDPDLAVAHKGRGRVCHMLGSLDESLYHFDAAMLLAPSDAHVVASRADLLADTGRYSDAAAEYRRAVQMDKTLAHAHRSAAWLLATCPEDDVRDPAGAMEFALKAIDLDRRENIVSLDTLAAAQANSGDFAAAITTMDRVLAMAPKKELSTYKYRQELYTDSKPFRIQPVQAVQPASYTK